MKFPQARIHFLNSKASTCLRLHQHTHTQQSVLLHDVIIHVSSIYTHHVSIAFAGIKHGLKCSIGKAAGAKVADWIQFAGTIQTHLMTQKAWNSRCSSMTRTRHTISLWFGYYRKSSAECAGEAQALLHCSWLFVRDRWHLVQRVEGNCRWWTAAEIEPAGTSWNLFQLPSHQDLRPEETFVECSSENAPLDLCLQERWPAEV